MKNGSLLRPAVMAVAAAFVVGCAAEAPTTTARVSDVSLGFIPGLPQDPTVTPRSAQLERVEVCKDFVMLSGAPAPSASFTINGAGNTFNLADGTCKEAWVRDAGENVTVNETAPPSGFITTIRVTSTSGAVTNVNGTSTTVPLFGTVGFLLEYRNVEEFNTGGCSLTQGYWKTHNATFKGGAPVDPTWALLPGGAAEGTTFFLSGKTWFEVFWTPVGGNAYYNLAHQYMAARLNVLSGADPTTIASTLTTATTLFQTYTPAQIGALSGNNSLRKQFVSLAGILGSYNEGDIGPGHCQD